MTPPRDDQPSTRPLLDKLGVRPGMRTATLGPFAADFLTSLRARAAEVTGDPAGSDIVFFAAEDRAQLAQVVRVVSTLRHDAALNHIHWATTRRPQPPSIMALAIDHRAQLEKIADDAGVHRERISAFKLLAVEVAAKVAAGRPDYGMLLDGKYGREALFRALDHDLWIGRPVEEPG